MWRMASEVLLWTYICVSMSTVTFEVNMHFFVGHVCCLGILSVILKNNKLGFCIRLRSGALRPNASTWQVQTTSFTFTRTWIPLFFSRGIYYIIPKSTVWKAGCGFNCLKGRSGLKADFHMIADDRGSQIVDRRTSCDRLRSYGNTLLRSPAILRSWSQTIANERRR